MSLGRTSTALGAFYRRLAVRIGKAKAITATARKLALLVYRALSGKLADAELWVGVADHLPYRLVATFKKHPDRPQLKAEFSSWNLGANISEKDFAFVPPEGATKIEMVKQQKN